MAKQVGRQTKSNWSGMFKPLHQDHAIESVTFRLTGSGEMAEHERTILDGGHEKYWKPVLPSVNQAQVLEIALGPTPLVDGRPKRLAPTQYVEFTRTGQAAWWMEIAGTMITVGCTQYGGWQSASEKAYGLFDGLGKPSATLIPSGKSEVRSLHTKTYSSGTAQTTPMTQSSRLGKTGCPTMQTLQGVALGGGVG